ncbi:quinoprotein amine dehydrogenase [Striga asiatica]|uniref:Quinoprotein amine dehydrogenase n=1 Tax=Striga asiatica TaxID=4170 RepID=A0A5A7PSV7_STRAF|nr:quinoprotein amine dehydrogenase [Striga asiatica]
MAKEDFSRELFQDSNSRCHSFSSRASLGKTFRFWQFIIDRCLNNVRFSSTLPSEVSLGKLLIENFIREGGKRQSSSPSCSSSSNPLQMSNSWREASLCRPHCERGLNFLGSPISSEVRFGGRSNLGKLSSLGHLLSTRDTSDVMVRILAGNDSRLGQSTMQRSRRPEGRPCSGKCFSCSQPKSFSLTRCANPCSLWSRLLKFSHLYKIRSSRSMVLPSGNIPSEMASSCVQLSIQTALSVAGKWATAHVLSDEHSLIWRCSRPDILAGRDSKELQLHITRCLSILGMPFSGKATNLWQYLIIRSRKDSNSLSLFGRASRFVSRGLGSDQTGHLRATRKAARCSCSTLRPRVPPGTAENGLNLKVDQGLQAREPFQQDHAAFLDVQSAKSREGQRRDFSQLPATENREALHIRELNVSARAASGAGPFLPLGHIVECQILELWEWGYDGARPVELSPHLFNFGHTTDQQVFELGKLPKRRQG